MQSKAMQSKVKKCIRDETIKKDAHDSSASDKQLFLKLKTCRFIIITKHLCRINSALLSRCILIRVKPSSNGIIKKYIAFWNKKLKLSISKKYMAFILKKYNKNLFILNSLLIYKNKHFSNSIDIYINDIHDIIINNDLIFIDKLRIIIYKAHLLDFKPAYIMKSYIKKIIKEKLFNNKELDTIIMEAALNDHALQKNTKYFFCLEKFFIVIKKILIYKNYESI